MLPPFLVSASPLLQQLTEPTLELLYECAQLPVVSLEHLASLLDRLTELLQETAPASLFCGVFFPAKESLYHLHLLRMAQIAEYLLLPEKTMDYLAYRCLTTFLGSTVWSPNVFPPSIECRMRRMWCNTLDAFHIWDHYEQDPIQYETYKDSRTLTRHFTVRGYNAPLEPLADFKDPFCDKVRAMVQVCKTRDVAEMLCAQAYDPAHRMDAVYRLDKYLHYYNSFECLRKEFQKEGTELHLIPVCRCEPCIDFRISAYHLFNSNSNECGCHTCHRANALYTPDQLARLVEVLGPYE